MKRKFFLLLACLATSVQTQAMDSCCTESCADIFGFDSVLTVGVGGGYREDNIKWTVFPVTAPGTVVKEKWSGIQTGMVEVGAQFLACESILVRADFDYGWFDNAGTQSIKTYDTASGDLLGDVHSKTKGRVYDVSGALGYQFNWCCYRYSFAPIAGYSYHHQKLVNKYYEVENELADNETEFKTHNTYNGHWSGPLLGFTTAYQVTCDWQIAFTYAYHWARFQSSVKEHFSAENPGVPDGSLYGKQKSNWGHGNEFTVFTSYEFCCDWLLGVNFNYKAFSSNKGKIKHNEIASPMRSIDWNTWNVCLDVAYIF